MMTMALLAITSLPLLAQGGPGTRPDGAGGRLNYLAGYLSLTETQKTQATAIFTAADTAAETVRGQLQSAQDALRASIKTNPADAELDRLAAATGVLQGQLMAISAKASAKFYALLTAEQKAKHDQMGGGRGGPGGMGPGGMGPGGMGPGGMGPRGFGGHLAQ
jgi:Spy/CpxP family protein refolding chaperone